MSRPPFLKDQDLDAVSRPPFDVTQDSRFDDEPMPADVLEALNDADIERAAADRRDDEEQAELEERCPDPVPSRWWVGQ